MNACLFRGAAKFVRGALVLLASMALTAHAERAQVIAAKSRVEFMSKQLGVPMEGTFKSFEAQIAFDPRHPEGGTIAVQIDTGSASLGIPIGDAELPKALWFDVSQFPQATFQSSVIKAVGNGKFDVHGRLMLKGVTRDLVVPVAIVQTPTGESVATGSFVLQRLEFRVGDGEWKDVSVVGNEVRVNFTFTLTGLPAL